MTSVDEGGQGLYFEPLVDPIEQKLISTAAAAAKIHGR